MALIVDAQITSDHWRLVGDPDAGALSAHSIVPLGWLNEALAAGQVTDLPAPLGVIMAADQALPDRTLLARVALIAIRFESFTDGRGFSLAAQLRREGFDRGLRAVGSIIPDQYPLALSCGFDGVEVSDEAAARYGDKAWAQSLRLRPLHDPRRRFAARATAPSRTQAA